MLATVAGVSAQEATALFDLTDRDTFDQCTQFSDRYEHDDYSVWNFDTYSKAPVMYNHDYITEPYYSDYLLSPEITLQAGVLYRIELAPAAYTRGKTGKLVIGVGQGSSMSKYTVVATIDDIAYAANAEAAEARTVDFNVPADGAYKIYFLGEGNALKLYNTKMDNAGTSDTPAAVSDLTLMPAADGSASVTIAFTLPAATVSGNPIDGTVKYRIYRGDNETAIRASRGNAGDYVTYTDNDATEGTATYSVEAEYNGNTSNRASATTFVGKETPNAVSGLKATKADGDKYVITWTAPTEGVHGALIDPTALTYVVTRVVDGTATVIADACTATTYSDTYTSDEIQSMHYTVAAVLNDESSTAEETESFTVGSLKLPFADSFAGASFGKVWTAEIISGTHNWVAVATNPYSTQSPKVTEAYDKDGGFAFYNAWSATRGCSARLATAPIKNETGSQPVVEFYVYQTLTGGETLKLQVSCDGGTWTDVEGAEVALKGTPQDWKMYQFPIASAIADGCQTFRLAFVAISQYGQNIILDKVRIFVPANKDLEASQPVAPASVVSGNDLNLSFTLANNGMTAVSATDYTLSLVTDYPTAITLPDNVDLPALSSATVNITVPVTAAEAKEADSYSFALKVDYEGDENPANNTSAAAEVAMEFVDKTSPSNPHAIQLNDNSIQLTWEPAGVAVDPVDVGTSFEGFDAGYTGPFDGFTSIDLDEAAGDNYYASGSAFNIVNNTSTPKGADGKGVIGLTLKANKQQDDWLISPALNCQEGSTMTLSFLIATRKFTSSSNYYTFDVVYATDDYDPENPSAAFVNQVAHKTSSLTYGDFIMSETFVPITVANIPAEAKYVAIHFISKIAYSSAMWIDKIRIQETVADQFLGYNVYENGVGRVNDTVISSSVNELNIPDTSLIERRYYVTAVYASGETAPSELSNHVTASVDNVESSRLTISTNADGIVVTGADALIYDLQGRCVAKTQDGKLARLAPGIYIVRAGAETRKVAVRAAR